MPKKTFFSFCIVLAALSLAGWHRSGQSHRPDQSYRSEQIAGKTAVIPSLRETFKGDFAIGTAMNFRQIEEGDPDAAALIPQQFNAVTPENIMKAEIIHPGWDRYNFEPADRLVAYAKKHNMI